MNHPDNTSEATALAITLSLASCSAKLTGWGARLASRARNYYVAPVTLATALSVLATHSASAQTAGGTGSLDSFLNNVVNMITGSTGQAIAIIAVAVCGLGAMFGALSARAFGGVVLGCAMVFSAAWIVNKITGGGT